MRWKRVRERSSSIPVVVGVVTYFRFANCIGDFLHHIKLNLPFNCGKEPHFFLFKNIDILSTAEAGSCTTKFINKSFVCLRFSPSMTFFYHQMNLLSYASSLASYVDT